MIDLGSSCFVTDHLSSYVQSRSYRAPEVILGLPYSQKVRCRCLALAGAAPGVIWRCPGCWSRGAGATLAGSPRPLTPPAHPARSPRLPLQVDIWSLGCILAELSSGSVLFQNDSLATLLARLEGILGAVPRWMAKQVRRSLLPRQAAPATPARPKQPAARPCRSRGALPLKPALRCPPPAAGPLRLALLHQVWPPVRAQPGQRALRAAAAQAHLAQAQAGGWCAAAACLAVWLPGCCIGPGAAAPAPARPRPRPAALAGAGAAAGCCCCSS